MSQDIRFIIVYRKSRLQELIERFNTWPQAQFYLSHNGTDPADFLAEHDRYQAQLKEAEHALRSQGPVQMLERGFLPSYQFRQSDLVVVIGQDGLVANTLKYLTGQPVIGVNPDPDRWDGKLLRFEVPQLKQVVTAVVSGKLSNKSVTFAEVSTNDGQSLQAVNDVFIGPKSHTSARYEIRWNGNAEQQSSSGIIISTGFGSTGWFQSILAGAMGVTGQTKHPMQQGFAWDSEYLQFSVREPFPSQTSGVGSIFGRIDKGQPMSIESLMPENGVIFSDGIEQDYLAFNAGCIARIGLSETKGLLVW